ncbi:MAG: rhodanese-like domain-containing protein [Thiohalomonadaceae bacterium]
MMRILPAGLVMALLVGMPLVDTQALEIKITEGLETVTVQHQGKPFVIQRGQDPSHVIDPSWGKTARKCPPFCLQPAIPIPGIHAVGELESLDFMEKFVNTGTGVLIDSRLPSWYLAGTIPGSINIPFTVFGEIPTDDDVTKALKMLGAVRRPNVGGLRRILERNFKGWFGENKSAYWDFTEAKEILLWCNGSWCGQSPRAIKNLVKLGYPKERIHYYRGGMQSWQLLGFPAVVPDANTVLFEVRGD